jgi:hypothetical protein
MELEPFFDVSSQENDLVVVRFSLVQFRLSPNPELGIDESRQVILLVPFLLETLPTRPLVSPYVALALLGKVCCLLSGKPLPPILPPNSLSPNVCYILWEIAFSHVFD